MTKLSDLYRKDLSGDAIFMMSLVSSHGAPSAQFNNTTKYKIHDIRDYKDDGGSGARMLLHTMLPITGNAIKVYLPQRPPQCLVDHWKTTLGSFYEEPVWTEEYGTSVPHLMLFPVEELDAKLQTVDPEEHYKVASKLFITETECPQPKVLSEPKIPCVMKTSHGFAGYGTFIVKSEEDLHKAKSKIEKYTPDAELLYTELIEAVCNYSCQFYLDKAGNVTWIGATESMVDSEQQWQGAVWYNEKQKATEAKLQEIVIPASKAFKKNNYFGLVAMDVLEDKDGKLYAIDINAPFDTATPLMILAREMGSCGMPVAVLKYGVAAAGTVEDILKKSETVTDGKIVVLSTIPLVPNILQLCQICIFATTLERVKAIKDEFFPEMGGPPPGMGSGGPPPGVLAQGGPPPGVMTHGGPPPGVMTQGGPPPGAMTQGGPPLGVLAQGGPPPGVLAQGGPPPGALAQAGLPPGATKLEVKADALPSKQLSPSVISPKSPPPFGGVPSPFTQTIPELTKVEEKNVIGTQVTLL
ncbi:unnamed protein product [Owenia fusiformis]|uniref:Uncharacterized protein n=1 Tax=Owenia fusiformis TaxID=6347 RepID=A0A8J1URS9_OWEFU|nr:unnamed protein product [Owenia fusiformis]